VHEQANGVSLRLAETGDEEAFGAGEGVDDAARQEGFDDGPVDGLAVPAEVAPGRFGGELGETLDELGGAAVEEVGQAGEVGPVGGRGGRGRSGEGTEVEGRRRELVDGLGVADNRAVRFEGGACDLQRKLCAPA
jgi:hypothetical protein